MISNEFLSILACPVCQGELVQTDTGCALLCLPCGLSYPVRDGIPVLLTDEAEKIPAPGSEAAKL